VISLFLSGGFLKNIMAYLAGVHMLDNNKIRVIIKHSVNNRYGAGKSVTIFNLVKYRLSRSIRETRRMYSLMQLVEKSDISALEHAKNVSKTSCIIGMALGLSTGELHKIRTAGFLHDIGKSKVPASLLTKPGRLTGEEMKIVRNHPLDGAEITSKVSEFEEIVPVIRHHHEKYDGTGYPGGLMGNKIPLFSRIISIADAYDAMVHRRPYSEPRSPEAALDEIHRCSGTQFDPALVCVLDTVSDYFN
jgi:putative nucleotidyltransferase with HDIG domain